MKNKTRLFSVISVIALFTLLCCTSADDEPQNTNPLIGVWELVYGDWDLQDSIDGPDPNISLESMKYYSGSHFFVIGMADEVYSVSGTYTCEGNKYVERIGLSSSGAVSFGQEVEISYSIKDDTLSLDSDWFKEKWKRVE